jgi:deoxyribodipyrimidine photo-lyase
MPEHAPSEYARALVWFRRDLRDFDHAALFYALKHAREVVCAFVFDRAILDTLPDLADRRVEFIRESLVELHAALAARGGGLVVRHDFATDAIPALALQYGCDAVFCNRDDAPAALARNAEVAVRLAAARVAFRQFKDCVIFERDEVLTGVGTSPIVSTASTPTRKRATSRR